MSETDTPPPKISREIIAKTVTIFVLCSVVLILISASILLVFLKGETDTNTEKDFSRFKDIVGMILPLLGTWIGTVLAYYFAKENFDAANKNAKDLVNIVSSDQKLKATNAKDKDVLILLADIKYFPYTTADEINKVLVSELIKFMTDKGVLRLPIITPDNLLRYCIHRSVFDKFISLEALKPAGKKPSDLTFEDFLNTNFDEIKNYIRSGVAFLKEDASLYDVKLIMEHNKYCQDVFITKTGANTEPVIGWITDGKILEKSKI